MHINYSGLNELYPLCTIQNATKKRSAAAWMNLERAARELDLILQPNHLWSRLEQENEFCYITQSKKCLWCSSPPFYSSLHDPLFHSFFFESRNSEKVQTRQVKKSRQALASVTHIPINPPPEANAQVGFLRGPALHLIQLATVENRMLALVPSPAGCSASYKLDGHQSLETSLKWALVSFEQHT